VKSGRGWFPSELVELIQFDYSTTLQSTNRTYCRTAFCVVAVPSLMLQCELSKSALIDTSDNDWFLSSTIDFQSHDYSPRLVTGCSHRASRIKPCIGKAHSALGLRSVDTLVVVYSVDRVRALAFLEPVRAEAVSLGTVITRILEVTGTGSTGRAELCSGVVR